ncbi:hypothetical protein FG05_30526 [Fusarium graminearum]|nr:hypothetical protein FG05_30526 [Fusarium graminearum]
MRGQRSDAMRICCACADAPAPAHTSARAPGSDTGIVLWCRSHLGCESLWHFDSPSKKSNDKEGKSP